MSDRLAYQLAVLANIQRIWQPGDVREVRILGAGGRTNRTDSGYFDDPKRLAEVIAGGPIDTANYYVTINPANPVLLARSSNRVTNFAKQTTSDKDIRGRCWLPMDFDPNRPSGVSSSDAEHEAAFQAAREMRDWLRGHGWPEPILADSGNGAHLLYAIDLPNDDASTELVKHCLQAGAAWLSAPGVIFDTAVFNAARIWKCYGVFARKGDSTPERPHRQSAIVEAPDALAAVTLDRLEALAALAPAITQDPPFRRTADSRGFDIAQWLAKYDLAVKYSGAHDGGTKWVLETCPFNPDHGHDAAVFEARDGRLGFRCFHNGCSGHTWHDLRELFEPKAQRPRKRQPRPSPAVATTAPPTPGDSRPHIDVDELDLPKIRAEAWQALQMANAPVPHLFRHGGQLARLTRNDRGAPGLSALGVDHVIHEMSNAALWVKIVFDDNGMVERPQHPPEIVARDLRADPDPPLPVVTRIVQSPVFAPDGSLSVAPGYCPASRTYFDAPCGFTLAEPAECPTAADVDAARSLIVDDLLADFPFAEPADRANAVALLLLPFVRDLIAGPTPLHAVEAPSPGSGKGLLVDVVTRIATGREPDIMTPASDEAEWRKKITSHLRNAPSFLLIDNISRPLDSDALAGALTAWTWKDRLLGTNDEMEAPVRCVWIATGNNLTVSTDLARRVVRIRLQPPVDRPWEREAKEFRHPHLSTWVAQHRPELMHACLVLGRAWIGAGRPGVDITLGSYEEYAAVVGGVLATAGVDGFLENRHSFYETADTEGETWRAFVAAWWEAHQSTPVGVADLRPIAEATEGMYLGKSDLLRAQQTALGKQLVKYRDRVLEGRAPVAGVNMVNLGEPPESFVRTRDAEGPHARAREGGIQDNLGPGFGRFTQVHHVHTNDAGHPPNGADGGAQTRVATARVQTDRVTYERLIAEGVPQAEAVTRATIGRATVSPGSATEYEEGEVV